MKILYAIQGTGNGHITVALEVLPYLMQRGQVDILISGTEVDVTLPYEIKYRFHGLCFVFGKKGGIDYLETYKKARLKKFFREIQSLPVEEYDLVFSDFEPVSAWACYLKNKACIGFSHQAAVANKASPKPKEADLIGQAVLRYYAPASAKYGFHFVPYSKNIFTPIIRRQIREASVTQGKHYTVYLPSYSEKRIIKLLSYFPDQQWHVFSKRRTELFVHENISFYPVTNEAFVQSMVSSQGVFCGAGFQTPSEALFLKKKLLVIPMKGQYEQQCNAAALKLLGIPVLKNIKPKQYKKLKAWTESEAKILLDFPDETEWVLQQIMDAECGRRSETKLPSRDVSSPSKFRNLVLKKIFYQLGS
ncbi:glycosyltransferase family protein [Flavisolibacter ginsenosidimutans]|uniref:Glycosyl transferase n=1 Tax=Flavisolibacter ginsenosidimutans TaxID=661481 RepID=A0A5B8UMB6_9BACT|nr:glycosyltransferase family protein [Flavisolibacter ginsenosidimutans]QEC57804.1 glycosyl transferase [Flavisolibacter ginsenosidimutans]